MIGLEGVAHAAATTYYVDAEGGDGSNGGTSEGSPLATIDQANQLDLDPGDRLLFKGGQSFDGNLQLDAEDAGTVENPVVVGSYGEGRASLSAGTATGISIYNAGGVEVSDLIVTGARQAAGNGVSGVEVYTDLENETKLEHVRLKNLEVSGFGDVGIILGAYPEDGTKSGFKDVRITGVDVHDNADAGIKSFGYFSSSASSWAHEDVYVGDCYTYDNKGIPEKGAEQNRHTGSGIELSDVDGATIERCVSYNNGENSNYPDGGPVGIWAWDSNAVTIQHNESYDNKTSSFDGGGFDLDGGVTNSVIQYNYSHDNYGPGYLLYHFEYARPFEDNVVRYNVSENDGRTNRGGIYLGRVSETEVHHNTVYVGARADGSLPPAVAAEGTSNVHFRDNLFVSPEGKPEVDISYGQQGLVFLNNDYRSGGSVFFSTLRHTASRQACSLFPGASLLCLIGGNHWLSNLLLLL